jgi:hypothetical protein
MRYSFICKVDGSLKTKREAERDTGNGTEMHSKVGDGRKAGTSKTLTR